MAVSTLRDNNFASIKKKVYANITLNRRKGLRELNKLLINEMANKNTKILLKHLLNFERPLKASEKYNQTTPEIRKSF
jgi:hypothetical protein